MVCWAVVGLMFPGLEAVEAVSQLLIASRNSQGLTFVVVLLRRLVDDCAVL